MSTMPIDLQVLFSKAAEQSENIARQANSTQIVYNEANEKIHKKSQEVDESVDKLDEYAEEFSKVDPEGKNQQEQKRKNTKKPKNNCGEKHDMIEDYKRAPKEEGTGMIIDIID